MCWPKGERNVLRTANSLALASYSMSTYRSHFDTTLVFWGFCLPPLLNSFSWDYQRLDNPGIWSDIWGFAFWKIWWIISVVCTGLKTGDSDCFSSTLIFKCSVCWWWMLNRGVDIGWGWWRVTVTASCDLCTILGVLLTEGIPPTQCTMAPPPDKKALRLPLAEKSTASAC